MPELAHPSKAELGGAKNFVYELEGGGIVKKKGDYAPEMYFIGQVVGGADFNEYNDGLFVEANLNYGVDWNLVEEDQTSGPL